MPDISHVEDALQKVTNWLTTGDCLKMVAVSLPTLIKWCEKYHIGEKIGGRWYIDPEKLSMLIKGVWHRQGYDR